MNVGVLASTSARARHIICTDPFLAARLGNDLAPLSSRSLGHRGRLFDAIFVDSDLWPLSEELTAELGPCLYASGGGFHCLMPQ